MSTIVATWKATEEREMTTLLFHNIEAFREKCWETFRDMSGLPDSVVELDPIGRPIGTMWLTLEEVWE